GLPKLKFEKDHLCSACAMGKSKKKPHKPKSKDTNQEKLYLMHIDLCGPTRVASVNGKKYILVIVDDYSRFIWVKCLRSKDEPPNFIIKFLKMIQVRLKTPARRIRTDNGTELLNQTLCEYYEKVGVSHETSIARSPQQNGVVERRNHEILTPPPSINNPAPEVIALIGEVVAPEHATLTGSPSSSTVDQDAPSPHNSQTTPDTQSPIIPNDVEEDNHDLDVAHMNNDPFVNILIPEVPSDQSALMDFIHTVMHPDYQISEHNSKWTKDHPLENIIDELARPVSTRLHDISRRWLEKEPPRSIHSWEDLVSKFINEFFPPSRTTNLRNEISNFQQRFDESFHEAWDRYKDLLHACLHHGFTELHQLDTFCNALNPADQDSLNAAAGENLLERRTQDVLTIIENKSKNMMASLFQMNFASTLGLGSLPRNTIANPKGELKAITIRSGLVLDGPTIPTPLPLINPEEDERVDETLMNPDLAEYTIKVPPHPVQKYKPPSQRDFVVHQRDPLHPNIPYPSRMLKQKQQEKDEV
nr:retrovirus-related Pol polyprotein from transposon TNT 1-94 [Tanacetum cinerariifolium]